MEATFLPTKNNWPRRFVSITLFVLVALSTNQLNYVTDHSQIVVGAGDMLSYYSMSDAAPGLITTPVPYHHAQRIFLPYLLGLLSKATLLSVQGVYLGVGTFLLFMALWFLMRCSELLELHAVTQVLISMLVLLNPYVYRHFIMFNGYINDIGFLAGISIILFGVLTQRRKLVLAGLAFSALSRQTTLLIIPAILLLEYGISRPRKWRLDLLTLSYLIVPAAIYIATAYVAQKTGLPSETKFALFGLFDWLQKDFSATRLLDFAIRGCIPFSFTAAMFVGFYRSTIADDRMRFLSGGLLFLVASICVQPILGGPDWTTNSIARLNALAAFPAALAVGIYINSRIACISSVTAIAIGGYLAIGSIHHIYTFNGVFNAEKNTWFAAVHFMSAALMALTIWLGFHEPSKSCES